MKRTTSWAALSAITVFVAACSGPPATSTLKDEPVCGDFDLGHSRMRGSLKQPLVVKVKSGSRTMATVHVNGLSSTIGHASLFLLPDANAEYVVEFYQCANERAPVEPAADDKDTSKAGQAAYKCGEKDGSPYTTSKLVTKRGDAGSRTVSVPPPPDTTCWKNDVVDDAPSGSSAP